MYNDRKMSSYTQVFILLLRQLRLLRPANFYVTLEKHVFRTVISVMEYAIVATVQMKACVYQVINTLSNVHSKHAYSSHYYR